MIHTQKHKQLSHVWWAESTHAGAILLFKFVSTLFWSLLVYDRCSSCWQLNPHPQSTKDVTTKSWLYTDIHLPILFTAHRPLPPHQQNKMSTVHTTTAIESATTNVFPSAAVASGAGKGLNKRSGDELSEASKRKLNSASTSAGASDKANHRCGKRQKGDEEDFTDIICPITRVSVS